MVYLPDSNRYDVMKYNRCGKSGIRLPALTLGFWYNFGGVDVFEKGRAMVRRAFDLGICYFDLANGYGTPLGSAEENFGRILKADLAGHRDELFISTKAGYYMWPGPYGDWGSRKYLISSLDQSLKRLRVEYVDVFYSHRPDPETPVEETMGALDSIVRQGKALYVGISSYDVVQTQAALAVLKQLGTPCLIHQAGYSMLNRKIESGLLPLLEKEGVGLGAFCPLAQGLLAGVYSSGIPAGSRAATRGTYFKEDEVTEDKINKVHLLENIAQERGQTIAQMALAWVLRGGRVATAVMGADNVSQIEENVGALKNLDFQSEELERIEKILQL